MLAGLDRIDPVFTDFVSTLDAVIRTGEDCMYLAHNPVPLYPSAYPGIVELRHRAIGVLLAITAGAYQTTLLTYMIQRDLFPAVMKVHNGMTSTSWTLTDTNITSSSKIHSRRLWY